ncbi:MAG: YfhO family protein, partial [Patescibacteria group bacterium]
NFTNGLSENLYYQNKFRDFNNFFKNKTRLNLLGIKYIISKRDLSKWFSETSKDVYENNNAYPRFILSKESAVEKDPKKILHFLDDPNYNPEEIIYIEKDCPTTSLESPSRDSSGAPSNEALQNVVKIVKYEEEYIKLEIENGNNKWLLANEIYYPGWQAKIDSKPIEIYKANYTFRAIPIPAGKHIIEFIFKPKSYLIGKTISLFAVLILIILKIFNFLFYNKKTT